LQATLLNTVEAEIRERLAQSLHRAVRLVLGMERQDYRIQRPWSVRVDSPTQTGVQIAAETRIVEVFDQAELQRQLLILGEPGSGKTTMMLELAEDLFARANVNAREPIPVLLNLSSWNNPKQSIFDWMLTELRSKYGVRKEVAQRWLEQHQLLPLLDGLDEVNPQFQYACAGALNAWLTGDLTHRPPGVVICCREQEYEEGVRQRLSLRGAVCLRPLEPDQMAEYFDQMGLAAVWETVQTDAELQAFLTKPLFLSMFGLVQTQQQFSFSDWRQRQTFDAKIEYLLDTYWEATMSRELITDPQQWQQKMLSKTYGKRELPSCMVIQRNLTFAAQTLEATSTTELLIEGLQPGIVLTRQQQWVYGCIFGLIFGLVIGLIWELVSGHFFGLIDGLFIWLINGLIAGLFIGLTGDLKTISPVEAFSFLSSRDIKSMSSLCQRLIASLLVWLINGLLLGLIFWLFFGLIYGLIFGLIIWLILGLSAGLKTDIQTRILPNQGIKNSRNNMLIFGTVSMILVLPFKLLLEYVLPIETANNGISILGAVLLMILILVSCAAGGGLAFAQHVALRLVLALYGYAPLHYDRRLDYCTERLLLQRLGGRYRFMHKLLQDYFARMELD
jgi:DNA polymerase III delta prime subunit